MTIPLNELVTVINVSLDVALKENLSRDQIKERLTEYINDLIDHNFNKLVNLLYKIDVSESRLKRLLDETSGNNAGDIIAELIIERQIQKIKSREQFTSGDPGRIDENEKW
jgi:DNA-binding protein Fis